MLNGENIREALALLDAALGERGIRGEICLFGGAVMVLAYQARQSTKDVDAVFAPAGPIRELAADIAGERGWEPDWINDGVKGWLSSRQDLVDAGLRLAHLAVLMPSPEYLLAMKCMAARGERGSRDLEDVKFLAGALGLPDAAAALGIVESYYPAGRIAVKTRYFIEAAFEEMAAAESQANP